MKITKIITHFRPHLDEIVAIAILKFIGEQFGFLGIKDAIIEFMDAGHETPDGRPWQTWQEEGVLFVGCGGSPFDEHPNPSEDRKEGHCAATLVAEHFGIHEEEWMLKLLKFTTNNDLKGGSHPFDIAAFITLMNKRWFKNDPQGVVGWALEAITVYLEEQYAFFMETSEEFKKVSKIVKASHRGRSITIAVIESGNAQMGAYSRSKFGANADLVIQKNSSGNVTIMPKTTSRIDMREVVRVIRLREMRKNNYTYSGSHQELKDKEGKVEGADCWYYMPKTGWILNGSHTATNVPPTKLSLSIIVEMTVTSLLGKQQTILKAKV